MNVRNRKLVRQSSDGFEYVFRSNAQTYKATRTALVLKWCFSVLKIACIAVTLLSFIFVLLALIVQFWIKSPIEAKQFRVNRPRPLTGSWAPNRKLAVAQKLFEGQLNDPKCVDFIGVQLYTATKDGKIVEIEKHKITRKIRLVKPKIFCDGTYATFPDCGRPLGLRASGREILVADAYLGVFSVNFDFAKVTQILRAGTVPVNSDIPISYLHDLEVVDDRYILLSESSTKWDHRRYFYISLEAEPNGRLLLFDRKTNRLQVLLQNLYFPHGITLRRKDNALFIAEATTARILKFDFLAQNSKPQVFADNLPGYPGMIRISKNDTHLWVPLYGLRRDNSLLAARPWARNLIAKLIPESYLVPFLEWLSSKYGLVVLLNDQAEVVNSWHDPNGDVISHVTSVADRGDAIYLGSDTNKFIGRVIF